MYLGHTLSNRAGFGWLHRLRMLPRSSVVQAVEEVYSPGRGGSGLAYSWLKEEDGPFYLVPLVTFGSFCILGLILAPDKYRLDCINRLGLYKRSNVVGKKTLKMALGWQMPWDTALSGAKSKVNIV